LSLTEPRCEATLKYIDEFRSYMSTYPSSSTAVSACMDASPTGAAVDGRWRCVERLMMSTGQAMHVVSASLIHCRGSAESEPRQASSAVGDVLVALSFQSQESNARGHVQSSVIVVAGSDSGKSGRLPVRDGGLRGVLKFADDI
jgi:hypothetical protein